MVPALHLPLLISGFPVHAHAFGFAFLPIKLCSTGIKVTSRCFVASMIFTF